MASRLNPYLNFDGNSREAMEYYQGVFGGDLKIMTFGDAGGGEGVDPDGVMHAYLEAPHEFALMASDMPPGEGLQRGNNFAVSLSGDDSDDLRGYWDKLTDGGQVTIPMEKQMWGDEFGMCIDRFGTPWMVNIVADQPDQPDEG